MLLIPCPHCGPRAEDEFSHGGDASITRPTEPASLDDAAWTAYLYLRDNNAGPHLEYWYHRFGCRRWFLVRRDTLSHRILGATLPGARRPEDTGT
jgi:sarcosine oxidase, subunit delta